MTTNNNSTRRAFEIKMANRRFYLGCAIVGICFIGLCTAMAHHSNAVQPSITKAINAEVHGGRTAYTNHIIEEAGKR